MSNGAPRGSADISRDLQREEEAFRRRTPDQISGEKILGYMRDIAIAISLVIPALGVTVTQNRPGLHVPSGVKQGVEERENPGANQDEHPQGQPVDRHKKVAGADDESDVASLR